jgi:hypothetical protein
MRFSIQNIFVQTNHIWLRKDKVEILERFRQPKRFHPILELWRFHSTVIQCRMRYRCLGEADDGVEHFPRAVWQRGVGSESIKNENGLNRFGTAGGLDLNGNIV